MNKKLLGVGALALAVALTSASVSGTYAKYTSQLIDGTDTARVAQWHLNSTSTVDLFEQSYDIATGGENEVETSQEDKIIAPGTSGDYSFSITGNTETNYTLSITPEITDGTNGRIKFSLDDTGVWQDATAFKTTLTNLNTKVFPAGKLPKTHTIKWKWEFEEETIATNDGLDTSLANQEVATNTAKVTFKINVKAVQSKLEATAISGEDYDAE